MSDKVRQLFEYLLEVNNLRAKVVRNFKEYDKNWTKASLEEFGDGVYLMGSGNDKEAILEIHRQKFTEEILTPPHPDKSIREWITYSYNKENNPPEIPNPKVVIQGSDKLEIRFEEDPRRIKLFNDWKAAWKDWADSISKMEKVQTLYELFFKINQDFQIEGEGLELMLGKTIFTWKTEVDPILHPLFTTKMDIELDTDKGIIIVKPTNQGFKLELNIFSGIPLPNIEEIQNIGRIARYRDVFEEDMNDLSTQFMQVIDASGRTALEDEPLIASKDAIGHLNEYVIVLRRKDNQVLQKDLEQIIESLQEEEFKVPATVESIVGHEFLTDKDLNNNNWGRVATDLYFPLASNENQKEIARRLASNYGLTVQGPPGTGKTHTIANLVSHLLAHGKKILITSQKESPLKVLKEKIPSEIRDLCVPVLGGGRDSLKEIETSIRTISDKLGNTTIEKLEAEITKNKEELEDSRRKEAKLKHQLMAYSKNEKTEIEYKGNFISKANTAQILTDESVDYHWILDKVELNSKFPISEEEFRTFWELRGKLEEKDLYLKDIVLPNIQLIKTTEEMKRWLSNGKNLKHKYDNAIFHTNKIKFPHDKSYTEKINNQLLRILQYKEFFKEGTVHQQILDDYIAGGSRKERWTSFFSSIKVLNKEMLTIYNSIVNHQITLPNKPDFELEIDISILADRLKVNKKPGTLFALTKGKNARYLWESPIINGKPIRTIEEIEILQLYLLLKKKKEEAVRIWNANIHEIGGIPINTEDKRLFSTIDKTIQTYEKSLQLGGWVEDFIQTSKNLLLNNTNWLNYNFYIEFKLTINCVFDVLNFQVWEKEYNSYRNSLKQLSIEKEVHPIIKSFLHVLDNKDDSRWEHVLEKLKHLIKRKEDVNRFSALYTNFAITAPKTANRIVKLLSKDIAMPREFKKSWELKSLYNWMTENQDFEAEQIEISIKSEQDYQKRLITSIVSNSTWLNQISRISESQKRALVAWKNFIKRYGKGTGNNKRYLADARIEMEKAQSAIPVWIMPVNQVIENFPIYNDKFDVIIFDESSQCDIMSIPVLLRGEKVVVVGDDEQISPYGIGTKDSEIEELIQRYLEGVPNKRLFDHKISLYEIADQIFPKSGRLMLKEHFRCVPEIIQFSNDLSYGGQMVPLRLPFNNEKIEPPVVAIKVEDGFVTEGTSSSLINVPEADKIVEDIEKVITDPEFEKHTIGVITLQGNKQATHIENKIREKISDSEFVKRKIICGNAYSLQGDERDIIFLSMVIAGNRRFLAMTKKEHQQTFNVAASRAKNQMRLYHSIELEEMNKNCYRYKFLNYVKNPTRVNEIVEILEEKCDSPFEIEVLRMIVEKGYKVQPQVKVGNYRIDLVIEGIRDRLAVECDSEKWHGPEKWEEDMQRQYDLERAGWKFWRVRGREFYYNKNKSLESLWEKLEQLGIEKIEN